jgi:hypothetical protein
MRRILAAVFVVGLSLFLISCAEVKKMDIAGITSKIPTGAVIGGGGFLKGEVLCATHESRGLLDNTYYVAKVVTPASAATKNQAEVILVSNGKKMWTRYVIPSHAASKEEIKLGMILFKHVWAGSEDISAESYRKQDWRLGRVSSTDELFKGVVEVQGDKSRVKWLRIPDQALPAE